MDICATGAAIRQLREEKGMTQAALAEKIGVTSKAVSKWETAKGLPDISLLQPLADTLGASVARLMGGEQVVNQNKSGNMARTKFHVCPVCGNIIHSVGDATVSCCGRYLPPLEARPFDSEHPVNVEFVEDERFITIRHEMTREHFISFLAFISWDRMEFVKLYPESDAEARMQLRGGGWLYAYCSRHGLMKKKI